MGRALSNLGWWISAALAAVILAASPAMAGDRTGGEDRGYRASDELEAVDPCATHQRVTGLECGPDGSRHVEIRRGASEDDLEAVDPCAVQRDTIGRGCEARSGGYERSRRVFEDSRGERRTEERYVDGDYAGRAYQREGHDGGRRIEEIEEVDPCAAQYRITGHDCASGEARYERERTYYPHRQVWRAESVYYGAPSADDGFVDACVAAHARMGDRCPYETRERIVETEVLPTDFFVSEGGVGGGIVDFGGGGGGGFVFSDSFAGANASASAMASASAHVSVSIMSRNMMKMHHWPHHGCGCKK